MKYLRKNWREKELKKNIDVKDDQMKTRDMEILNIHKKLNEKGANSFSSESLNKRNEVLEEDYER